MSEELEQNLRDAQVALDAAQMGYRRELWRLALHEYERAWPAAELVVMIRASGFYDSVPVALYDAQGTLVADLVGDSAPFGAMEPNLDYERMILDAGWQVHDPLVQRAVDDTVARHAGNEEVAVERGVLGTIYLDDVRAFLASDRPSEIALRRKELAAPEPGRTRVPGAVEAVDVPVAVTAGIDGHGDHHGIVFPGEPAGHVHPTVWVTKRTLNYLNDEANHGEPDHEPAGERRLEVALVPPTMNVRAIHDELAGLGYDQGLALYAVPSSLPIVIRGYHQPADQAPLTTTVEGATPFTVEGSGPDM